MRPNYAHANSGHANETALFLAMIRFGGLTGDGSSRQPTVIFNRSIILDLQPGVKDGKPRGGRFKNQRRWVDTPSAKEDEAIV